MKLHLPKGLKSAVLACMAVASGFATTVGVGVIVGGTMTAAFVAPQAQADYIWTGGTGNKTAADWNTAANWNIGDATFAGSGPGTPNSDMWAPIVVDGSVTFGSDTDRSLLLEGWMPQYTLNNGATIYGAIKKFQSTSVFNIDNGSHLDLVHNSGHFEPSTINIGANSSFTLKITADEYNGAMTLNLNAPTAMMNFTADSAFTLNGPIIVKTELIDVKPGTMVTQKLGITSQNVTLSNLSLVISDEYQHHIKRGPTGEYYVVYYKSGSDGDEGDVTISHIDTVFFSGYYSSSGGAIYADGGAVTISQNGDVTFSDNSASSSEYTCGGAIYTTGGLNICNNGDITFTENSVYSNLPEVSLGPSGGAIYATGGLTISYNGDVSFSGNSATHSETTNMGAGSSGGAIYATGGLTISYNRDVTFSGNSASDTDTPNPTINSSYGGAIYARGGLTINYNGDVTFSGNSVSSCNNSHGGAICAGDVIISNNANISFVGNSSSTIGSTISSFRSYGGAIYADDVTISNNANVSFSGNVSSAYSSTGGASTGGGAIYADDVTISNNANVTFSGNSAYYTSRSDIYYTSGGAIYADSSLTIQGNDSVLFEKNYEISRNSRSPYRLLSIHSTGGMTFSSKTGGNITFYDSVYSSGTTYFNSDYTDADGNTRSAKGDIIFSGKYTEQHLNEILVANNENRTATDAEILDSRTSVIYAMTNLCGGRLRIEDGAIYRGNGITVAEGANATLLLKDGELSHAGYDITISAGSTLSAVGENIITASTLAIQDGGTMHLALDMSQADSAAVLTTTGNLSMGNISFDLTGTEYLLTGEYKLLTRTEGVDYDISGWTLNGATSDQLRWENGTLYYTANHDWNHGVTDDDDISDLEEIIGNLIINGGDITLDDVVQAIQDAVDAGFGHGQGHIVINRGGIHISGAGDLDGHIIFNGDLKDIRKLFIEKDITSIKIELGGSTEAENIVAVGEEYTVEIDELSGDGGMSKTGQGEMVVHGNGHKVGGTVAVQEGALTFTMGNQPAGGENRNSTEVHELVVGNDDDKDARVQVNEGAQVVGDKLHVNGKHAVVTNDGSMEFTEEVRVKGGRLNNNGAISRVTLEGGKVTGSGSFAGLEMLGGELVVGNSPGLQTYTDDVELTEGIVTFSLADAGTAATADTYGWRAAAYSTIDMSGNALTIGADVRFVLEIGGGALDALTASSDATLTFSLSLIQNIASESLTLNSEALAELLSNTSIIITSDAEGLTTGTLFLAGRDITSMLSNGEYSYEGNTLVFKGTVTNDGSLTVPEPTTATLSLLALAALASRRRRR